MLEYILQMEIDSSRRMTDECHHGTAAVVQEQYFINTIVSDANERTQLIEIQLAVKHTHYDRRAET